MDRPTSTSNHIVPHDVISYISRAIHTQTRAEFDWRWSEVTKREGLAMYTLTSWGVDVVNFSVRHNGLVISGIIIMYEWKFPKTMLRTTSRENVVNFVRDVIIADARADDHEFLIREIMQKLSVWQFAAEFF